MYNLNIYIEEKAEKLLLDANCYSIPVNVQKCAEYLNIQLQSMVLDDDISGFLIMKDQSVYIGYNKSNITKRQRFTIAHEIGHYLLHTKDTKLFIDKTEKVLYRDLNSSTGELLKEREANAFAASLLMPRKLILEEIEKLENVTKESFISKLSKKFNVSDQAITIRLANLGLIDYNAFIS